jgi:hypothetical protein
VIREELESGLLPAPAGSATLSVSWRARSRQIRDHHRAQRRGSSRRYKRRLTLLQEGVSWLHSLLCSAPLRALDVVTQQAPGLSEIAFIHALLRQSMARSARRYHGPYLVVAQYCMSRRSLRLLTTAYGTKRTYRDDLLLVRFRATADLHARVASTVSVAIDPKRTLRGPLTSLI